MKKDNFLVNTDKTPKYPQVAAFNFT